MTTPIWEPATTGIEDPKNGLFYGWWLAFAGSAIIVVSTVPVFLALPLWSSVFSQSFGWTAGQLAWALTLSQLKGVFVDPIAGWAVQKLGPRRVIIYGLACVGAGFLLFSRVANLWMFYLAFAICSLGAGFCSWLPVMTVLNNWFHRRRATAMSIPAIASVVGGVAIVPLMAWAIGSDVDSASAIPDRLGWRNTAFIIGVIGLGAAAFLGILVRNRPEDHGQHPDGIPAIVGSLPAPDYTLREALKSRIFWIMAAGFAGSSIGTTALTYQGFLMLEHGFSSLLLGIVVVVQLAASTVSMLIGGVVGDRVPIRRAIFAFSLLQCIALGILVLATTLPMFILSAFVVGVGIGARTPLTTAICGTYFGRRSFPTITSIAAIPSGIAIGVLPALPGLMGTGAGDLIWSLTALALAGATGSVAFLFMGDPRPSPSQWPQARALDLDSSSNRH